MKSVDAVYGCGFGARGGETGAKAPLNFTNEKRIFRMFSYNFNKKRLTKGRISAIMEKLHTRKGNKMDSSAGDPANLHGNNKGIPMR